MPEEEIIPARKTISAPQRWIYEIADEDRLEHFGNHGYEVVCQINTGEGGARRYLFKRPGERLKE